MAWTQGQPKVEAGPGLGFVCFFFFPASCLSQFCPKWAFYQQNPWGCWCHSEQGELICSSSPEKSSVCIPGSLNKRILFRISTISPWWVRNIWISRSSSFLCKEREHGELCQQLMAKSVTRIISFYLAESCKKIKNAILWAEKSPHPHLKILNILSVFGIQPQARLGQQSLWHSFDFWDISELLWILCISESRL